MDLLGRKVSIEGGLALELLERRILRAAEEATAAGVDRAWSDAVVRAIKTTRELTLHLTQLGSAEKTLLHSVDYLDLFSTVVVSFTWLLQATAARRALAKNPIDPGFYDGKLCAA